MSSELLSSSEAADKLGISVATLYDWLGQSDAGEFQLRGQPVTIAYLQGGHKGQGRIKIFVDEIHRLLTLMRATPRPKSRQRQPRHRAQLHHITSTPGRPDA